MACIVLNCCCDGFKDTVDNQGSIKCDDCHHMRVLHCTPSAVDELMIKELAIAANISCHSLIPMLGLSTYSKQFSAFDLIPIPTDESLTSGGNVCCTCDGYRTDYESILYKYGTSPYDDVCQLLPSLPCSKCTHPLLTHHIINEGEKRPSWYRLLSSNYTLPPGSLVHVMHRVIGDETSPGIGVLVLLPGGKLLLNTALTWSQLTLPADINNASLLTLPQGIVGTHITSVLIEHVAIVAIATDKEVFVLTSMYPAELHTIDISDVTSLSLWSDATVLYATSWMGVVTVVSLTHNGGRILASNVQHSMILSSGITCSTLSLDAKYLYLGTDDGRIHVYDVGDFTNHAMHPCSTADVTCITDIPQIQGVAVGSADNNIQIVALSINENKRENRSLRSDGSISIVPITTLQGHLSFVGTVGVVGPHLVSIGWDAQLISWPLTVGTSCVEVEPTCCYKLGPQYHTMLLPKGLWNTSSDTFAVLYLDGSGAKTLALYRVMIDN